MVKNKRTRLLAQGGGLEDWRNVFGAGERGKEGQLSTRKTQAMGGAAGSGEAEVPRRHKSEKTPTENTMAKSVAET